MRRRSFLRGLGAFALTLAVSPKLAAKAVKHHSKYPYFDPGLGREITSEQNRQEWMLRQGVIQQADGEYQILVRHLYEQTKHKSACMKQLWNEQYAEYYGK